MKKCNFVLLHILFAVLLISSCKNKAKQTAESKSGDDILTGKLPVLVDQTIVPILQESADVFESSYPNSAIEVIERPEIKAINALLADSAAVILLTRKLSDTENAYFEKRGIQPKIYQIATDGIVFIRNVVSQDTIMTKNDVKALLEGQVANQKLIFDNANSSTLRYLKDYFKLPKIDPKAVSALSDNESVIQYVAKTPDAIGVIGYNWYLKAIEKNSDILKKIRTLSIENMESGAKLSKFYQPTQANIASELYPFTRPVYVLNYQPNMGLGLGFSAFLTGDRGQRIILKSGLVPATMPGREIIIREESYIK